MSEVSRQEIREVLEDALKRASIPFTESQLEAMVGGYSQPTHQKLVEEWCQKNGAKWVFNEIEWTMLHDGFGFHVAWTLKGIHGWDFGKPEAYFTVGNSFACGECKTLAEAQWAAITAYEGFKKYPIPSDQRIHSVALDESNRHDWNDLRYKTIWQDGFEDGAKWMRS